MTPTHVLNNTQVVPRGVSLYDGRELLHQVTADELSFGAGPPGSVTITAAQVRNTREPTAYVVLVT